MGTGTQRSNCAVDRANKGEQTVENQSRWDYIRLVVKKILKSVICNKENNFKYNTQDEDQNIKIMLIDYLYSHCQSSH